jgi:hypothetical protein
VKLTDGYQVIEPTALGGLLSSGANEESVVALLCWLVETLRDDHANILAGAEVDVIPVEYAGVYAAIGVRYPVGDHRDREEAICAAVRRILNERCVSEFAAFLERSGVETARTVQRIYGGRK